MRLNSFVAAARHTSASSQAHPSVRHFSSLSSAPAPPSLSVHPSRFSFSPALPRAVSILFFFLLYFSFLFSSSHPLSLSPSFIIFADFIPLFIRSVSPPSFVTLCAAVKSNHATSAFLLTCGGSSSNTWTDIESSLASTNRFVFNASVQRLSWHKNDHGYHRAASNPSLE